MYLWNFWCQIFLYLKNISKFDLHSFIPIIYNWILNLKKIYKDHKLLLFVIKTWTVLLFVCNIGCSLYNKKYFLYKRIILQIIQQYILILRYFIVLYSNDHKGTVSWCKVTLHSAIHWLIKDKGDVFVCLAEIWSIWILAFQNRKTISSMFVR